MALRVRMNVPAVPEALEAAVEGVVRLNEWYMRTAWEAGVDTPDLYTSGIVYRREPRGREWWQSADETLALAREAGKDAHGVVKERSGDCEDLAAYRAAELRTFFDDPYACVRIVRTRRGSFHAIVQRGDGEYEDPSRILLAQERARIFGGQ
jgi:hypothetical protein